MVIPYTTENQKAAEEWINYIYDRANYAKLIDATRYVPVLSDMTDELNKVNPELATNPLINPTQGDAGQTEGLGAADRRADPGIQQGVRRSHRRLIGWRRPRR